MIVAAITFAMVEFTLSTVKHQCTLTSIVSQTHLGTRLTKLTKVDTATTHLVATSWPHNPVAMAPQRWKRTKQRRRSNGNGGWRRNRDREKKLSSQGRVIKGEVKHNHSHTGETWRSRSELRTSTQHGEGAALCLGGPRVSPTQDWWTRWLWWSYQEGPTSRTLRKCSSHR